MGSIGRSIRRKRENIERKRANKEFREKMQLSALLSEECVGCESPFDKSNKQMIDEWYMIVRKHPDTVNLYCPQCWKSTIDNIEKMRLCEKR